jgi:hypothetical protein
MSTRLPGDNPTAYLGLKETNPPQLYFRNRAPLVTDSRPYDKGDIWIDEVALEGYTLARNIGGVATWIGMAGGVGLDTLTGNAGGAVPPDGADNINFLGAGGLTVTGNPGTFTLTVAPSGGGSVTETLTGDAGGAVGPDGVGNIDILGNTAGYLNGIQFTGTPGANTMTAMDLRNITIYVVDAVAGQTEYQTVQAAINAANAAGGGTVYIRPGVYIEDLVLYDAVDLTAAVATPAGYQTTITGVHTPPATGTMSIRNLALTSATDILNSAVAGTTTIVIIDCITDCATGYTFNLANWTGLVAFIGSHSVGTQDGMADIGAGGADFLGLNSTMGVGTAQVGALGGTIRINNCNINCQMDWVGTAAGVIRSSQVTETWLVSDNASCVMTDTLFINSASQTFLNHTSNGNVTLSNVTISTDQDPNVITGTGTVIFGSVVFTGGADINAGITKESVQSVETGPVHIGSGATDITNHIDIVEEVIGDDVTIYALNTDNTGAASHTIVNLLTGGASGGDPFLHLEILAGTDYSFGIDNSDGDILKLTDGASPSAGTEILTVDPGNANAITFNAVYEFPTADGNAGETLVTDGAGNVDWAFGALAWVEVTAATQAMAVNTAYGANRGAGVTFTLPATAVAGTVMKIVGMLGLWVLAQNAGQSVEVGMFTTTVGAGGSLTATNLGDCITLRCIVADTTWRIESMMGNPAIV